MGRRANPHKEHNVRLEKTINLWNRLVDYHNYLIRINAESHLFESFWKTFKPLLPVKLRSKIPKNNLKKVYFNKMKVIKRSF